MSGRRPTIESRFRGPGGRRRFVLLLLLTLPFVAAPAAAESPPGGFLVHGAPKPLPDIAFRDGEGNARSLEDFRGKVVLLNIWATWCTPCRREMPTLDRLQGALVGKDFEVIALSIDRAGAGPVGKFYGDIGITRLATYIDVSGKAVRDVGAPGLPTTLLVDRKGREAGRLVGPAEWDSPAMMTFIRNRIAKESNR
jgi:thiol-disulfide isomerase/thioredoxin